MAKARTRDDEPWSVSMLADRIDGALKQALPKTVRVRGEVSGFRERTHWYFDLKDEGAVVHCAVFASVAARTRYRPENGQAFVVTGRIEFYSPQGKTTLIATSLTPAGAGELELRFRALCEELRALGWFAPERKRPLPKFPRRVALITSRSAAALQDVIDTAKRRMPAVELVLIDVRVQGSGAAGEIAEALASIARHHERIGIDAVIVTRGGGSIEDLWAFNERIVAEAIVHCPIPVVAAIGHETDTTIAELVADERCATPTQAAMKVVPDRQALRAQVTSLERRIRSDVARQTHASRQMLSALARRPALADPAAAVRIRRAATLQTGKNLRSAILTCLSARRRTLDQIATPIHRFNPRAVHKHRSETLSTLIARMRLVIRRRLAEARPEDLARRLRRASAPIIGLRSEQVRALERHLRSVSPLAVLQRGYSITTDEQGRVLRSATETTAGQRIETRLAQGRVISKVEESRPIEGESNTSEPPPAKNAPPKRVVRTHPPQRPQMDLFGEGG